MIQTIQRIKERNWLQACEEIKLKIHSGYVPEHEILALVQQFDALKRNVPKVLIPAKEPPCLKTV
jgi:DNA primase